MHDYPRTKNRAGGVRESGTGSLPAVGEGVAELPSSPEERVRYWCALIATWRRRHGSRVPEPFLMGLSEAEYTAALDEVALGGQEADGIGALEAAVARVRRRVIEGSTA
jgi:hypothetical protein